MNKLPRRKLWSIIKKLSEVLEQSNLSVRRTQSEFDVEGSHAMNSGHLLNKYQYRQTVTFVVYISSPTIFLYFVIKHENGKQCH